MNYYPVLGLVIAAAWLTPVSLRAQSSDSAAANTVAATNLPHAEAQPAAAPADAAPITESRLQEVVAQVQAKARAGKRTEADYANELASLDELVAQEKAAGNPGAVEAIYLKAVVCFQVLQDFDKAAAIMRQITNDYPNTVAGENAAKVLPGLDQMAKAMAAAKAIQDGLAPGAPFPDFTGTNLAGGPLSVSALKGRVVLVDFWATWCPPCRRELPNLIQTYQTYHPHGLEVIGVSLDSDRATLDTFLQQQDGMTWPQYFDGQGWGSQLAKKYGINQIPFTILIGPDGKIIGKELFGEALTNAVAVAVSQIKANGTAPF